MSLTDQDEFKAAFDGPVSLTDRTNQPGILATERNFSANGSNIVDSGTAKVR